MWVLTLTQMILIIDKSKKERTTVSEMFHYMGILSYAVTPQAAFSEISTKYRAILITNPDSFPDITDYISRLRRYSANIPIFALSPYPERKDIPADGTFDYDIYSSTLVNEVIKYQEERSLPSLGKYLIAGLDLGCDIPTPRYFAEPLKLTKTETMIVRYLTVAYPSYASAEEILKHSLKPGKIAEPSVIRAHISSINKKFFLLKGRSLIISSPGSGYVIATPEILEKQKHLEYV